MLRGTPRSRDKGHLCSEHSRMFVSGRGWPEGQENPCPQVNCCGLGHHCLSPASSFPPAFAEGPSSYLIVALLEEPSPLGSLSTPQSGGELVPNPLLSRVVQNSEGGCKETFTGVPGKVACLLLKEAHQRLGLLLRTVGKVAWTCSPPGEMPAPGSICCCERRNRDRNQRTSVTRLSRQQVQQPARPPQCRPPGASPWAARPQWEAAVRLLWMERSLMFASVRATKKTGDF